MLLLLGCTAPVAPVAPVTPDPADTAGPAPYTLSLAGELALPGAMDVWGEGDTVVLAGGLNRDTSVLIADIADPTNPVTLATISGLGQVRDVELHGGVLYAASDCNCQPDTPEYDAWDGVGVRLYDLADPTAPRLLATIGAPTASVHNLTVSGGVLYATSMLENAVVLFDVSDPAHPVEIGRWAPPDGGVHDQTLAGDRLYVAHGTGFSVVDVSDRAAPVTLQTVPVALLDGVYTNVHNVWPIDADHVAVTQEQIGGKLEVWDLTTSTRVATLVDGEEPNCAHTAYVFDGRLYVAWYLDGVRAFDLTDPAAPTLAAAYDTFAAATTAGDKPDIRGAWGLWADAGRVVVGDTERGLVVLTEGGG